VSWNNIPVEGVLNDVVRDVQMTATKIEDKMSKNM
jgi:hypothetical protein